MSKRKNTLNDLEEFLKLQASTLVAPQPVEMSPAPPAAESRGGDSAGTTAPKREEENVQPKQEVIAPQPIQSVTQPQPLDLLTEMKRLAAQNRNGFYDFIIKSAETMPNGKSDVLLINTALYLKHGDNWKQGIEEYWKGRKPSIAG